MWGDDALRLVTVTVISIALGVLIGTAGYRSLEAATMKIRRLVSA